MDMEAIRTSGFRHTKSGFRQQEQTGPVARQFQLTSTSMGEEGETGTRFRREDGQMFIIPLNGQCLSFHRLPGRLPSIPPEIPDSGLPQNIRQIAHCGFILLLIHNVRAEAVLLCG